MHFSVLVPVQIPVITDEEAEKTESQIETQPTSEVTMDNILEKLHFLYEQVLSAPFAAAVDKAVTKAMAPYAQDAKDKYCVFEDETEDLQNQFETGTTQAISYRGTLHQCDDFPGFRVCADGVVREITSDGTPFLSAKAKQMVPVTVTYKELYGSFRKFANQYSVYHSEQKAWGYYYNPNNFWDWYSIGGRWMGSLLVKEDCEDEMLGISGAGDNAPPPAPEGYKWTSAARIKDIQLDMMAKVREQELRQDYAKYLAIWNHEAEPEDQYGRIDYQNDGLYCWGTKVFDPSLSEEQVVANAKCDAAHALSHLFYGYLDTNYEPPENGYFTHDDYEDDWSEHVVDFVSDFDEDTVLVTVDCHM